MHLGLDGSWGNLHDNALQMTVVRCHCVPEGQLPPRLLSLNVLLRKLAVQVGIATITEPPTTCNIVK